MLSLHLHRREGGEGQRCEPQQGAPTVALVLAQAAGLPRARRRGLGERDRAHLEPSAGGAHRDRLRASNAEHQSARRGPLGRLGAECANAHGVPQHVRRARAVRRVTFITTSRDKGAPLQCWLNYVGAPIGDL
eukprot:2907738-Prymnesium_polylepis.1